MSIESITSINNPNGQKPKKTNQKSQKSITGNKIVDQMIHFQPYGHIIDDSWYKIVTFQEGKNKGKPHLIAITILSEIVDWYRPKVTKTNRGKVLSVKFSGKVLELSRDQLIDRFGISKKQADTAFTLLRDTLSIIKTKQIAIRDHGSNAFCGKTFQVKLNVETLLSLMDNYYNQPAPVAADFPKVPTGTYEESACRNLPSSKVPVGTYLGKVPAGTTYIETFIETKEKDKKKVSPPLKNGVKKKTTEFLLEKFNLYKKIFEKHGIKAGVENLSKTKKEYLSTLKDFSLEDHEKVYKFVLSRNGWAAKYITFKSVHKPENFETLLEQAEKHGIRISNAEPKAKKNIVLEMIKKPQVSQEEKARLAKEAAKNIRMQRKQRQQQTV